MLRVGRHYMCFSIVHGCSSQERMICRARHNGCVLAAIQRHTRTPCERAHLWGADGTGSGIRGQRIGGESTYVVWTFVTKDLGFYGQKTAWRDGRLKHTHNTP